MKEKIYSWLSLLNIILFNIVVLTNLNIEYLYVGIILFIIMIILFFKIKFKYKIIFNIILLLLSSYLFIANSWIICLVFLIYLVSTFFLLKNEKYEKLKKKFNILFLVSSPIIIFLFWYIFSKFWPIYLPFNIIIFGLLLTNVFLKKRFLDIIIIILFIFLSLYYFIEQDFLFTFELQNTNFFPINLLIIFIIWFFQFFIITFYQIVFWIVPNLKNKDKKLQ